MKSIIRNFIAKMVAGRSDDGIMITLKDPKKVDFQTAMMEDLLMRNGIDPRAIKRPFITRVGQGWYRASQNQKD